MADLKPITGGFVIIVFALRKMREQEGGKTMVNQEQGRRRTAPSPPPPPPPPPPQEYQVRIQRWGTDPLTAVASRRPPPPDSITLRRIGRDHLRSWDENGVYPIEILKEKGYLEDRERRWREMGRSRDDLMRALKETEEEIERMAVAWTEENPAFSNFLFYAGAEWKSSA